MEQEKTIKGYKGFNPDMKCRDFQYEIGKTYEMDGNVEICKKGFHFCENPLDVLKYYSPADCSGLNRFCEVEGSGTLSSDTDDSKIACSKIKIGAEIKLDGLIKAGVNFILEKVKQNKNTESNTGDWSAATNTGNCSAATNTGKYSAATNTGYYSAATNTGDYSAATNTGDRSSATNTGKYSAATNTGNCSAATNTGYYSAATNTGDYSAATNTGDRSSATNTGKYSAATNTGNCSAATNTGYYSAATNTGDYSAATNTGDRSSATNTGDWSAACVSGEDSIAIVTGYKSKARGTLGCWIVLTEREEWDGKTCPIIEVKAFKVDGKLIKENVYYTLKDGVAVEVEE